MAFTLATSFSRPALAGAATARRAAGRQSVAVRADAGTAATAEKKKLSPLERGGTLSGEQAAGKDAGAAARAAALAAEAAAGPTMQIVDGRFMDSRWAAGRWTLSKFAGADGATDWDAVIDAEMARRKLLEETPIPSTNEDPVFFDTSEIPWWAWVRRFHLPEAEKLNGRAAMLGYVLAFFVDSLSGVGIADQQNSFLGKLALHACVFAVLLFRSSSAPATFKGLLDEATYYDKQWKDGRSWEGGNRPTETER